MIYIIEITMNKGVDFKLLDGIKKILKENPALFPSEIARILNKNAGKVYANKIQRYIKKYIKLNKKRNISLEELKVSSKDEGPIKRRTNNFRISLDNLPENRVYVGITASLNKKIVGHIENVCASQSSFSREISVKVQSLRNWITRKEYPLVIIRRIIQVLGINFNYLEKNIDHIKSGYYPQRGQGGNLSKPIFPKFPIPLSKELVRIIAHFFGDGCVSVDKRQYITVSYYNNNKKLRELFKEDMRKIFGNIHFKEAINKTTHYIGVPGPVGLILIQIIGTFNSKKGKVPNFIMDSNLDSKKEFIKAFFDDEAYVRYQPPHRYIEITLSNNEFIKDLKEMLVEFGINSTKIASKISKGKFLEYTSYIRNHENLKRFYNMINFNHTKKKENLGKIVENPGRLSYAREETKEKIVTLLNKTALTSTELSKILNRKRCTIHQFINKLKEENKICRVGVEGKHVVWGIKDGINNL